MLKMVKMQKRSQTWHLHISDWATYFSFIRRYLILEQQSSREFKTAFRACVMPYCLLYLHKDMLRCVPLNVHTCGYLNVWFKRKRKTKQNGKDLEVILSTMKQNRSSSAVSPRKLCSTSPRAEAKSPTLSGWAHQLQKAFQKLNKKQEFK